MKRSEILGVFFFVSVLVFLGFASAACSGDQAILNLSSSLGENAHASFFNQTYNYPYGICFNERFTNSFSGATRTCDASRTNGVIGLSSLTNAHVEGVLLTNYSNDFDVCYGNLACTLRQSVGGAVPCIGSGIGGEANMFSIYSLSNAHAAKLGYYTYTLCCAASGYTPKCNNNGLCQAGLGETADNCCDCAGNCTVGGTTVVSSGGITGVYWSNGTVVAGTLEQISNSYVNNSAYLVADVSGATDGSQVTFNIYENDTNGPTPSLRTLTGVVQGGRAYIEWPISDADIVAGLPETDSIFEYYFIASYGSASVTSSTLNVRNQNGPNVAPVAVIGSPADDSTYFVGETVTFTSGSFDRDGRASIQWDIADTITNASATSFQHAYTVAGDKIITLTATDNDGAQSTAKVVISIVSNGTNIHTKINKPYQGEDIFNYTIAYNGSGSWVINISGSPSTAVCLGGNCPATIGATSVPVTGTRGNYSSMFYSWTYSDTFLISSQEGFANVTGSRTYKDTGAKKIYLNVSAYGVSSKVYNDFTINEPSGCSADGLFFVSGSSKWSTLTQTESICNMATPNCCPRIGDYACVLNSTTNKNVCQAGNCSTFFTAPGGTTAAITLCDHYNNVTGDKQARCNADCARAGASDQQLNFIKSTYGLGGYQINNVRCSWNTATSKCEAAFTSGSLSPTIPAVEVFSGCKEEIISQSECTADNYQVVTWKTTPLSASPSAQDLARCNNQSTQTVLCGTPVIALPFFSLGNIIAVVIIIVLVYLIISYSRKNKSVKGKKRK